MPIIHRLFPWLAPFAVAAFLANPAQAQDAGNRHLAPGFQARPAQSRLLIVAPEMELFSISAGGVQEPRADWTEAAQQHFRSALLARRQTLGGDVVELDAAQLDEHAALVALHRVVAEAIFYHHAGTGPRLPTKEGRLDWTMGEAVRVLKARTGADYALFTWIRDSYASPERKAAMLAMALLGSISLGGEQIGYASLVDLNDGRVVWFNELQRMSGDLREAQPAAETVEALLKGFPATR